MSESDHTGIDLTRPTGLELPSRVSSGSSQPPATSAEGKRLIPGGKQFNKEVQPVRQGILEDIQRRYKGDNDRIAREISRKFEEWQHDPDGINYLAVSGVDFSKHPIEFHGSAQYLAFTGNNAPGSNFEDADLTASVMTGSILDKTKFRRAKLDHALMPFASLRGADMRDISALDVVWNFVDIKGARLDGSRLTGAYFIGLEGLDERMLQTVASITGGLVLGALDKQHQSPNPIERALSTRFITGGEGTTDQDMLARKLETLSRTIVHTDERYIGKLASGQIWRGRVLNGVRLGRTRLTEAEMEGAVLYDVYAPELSLTGSRMGGVTAVNTNLDKVNLSKVEMPGNFWVNCSIRDTHIDGAVPGTLAVNCDFSGTTIGEDAARDGFTIIGGTPPEIESGEYSGEVKILTPQEMPLATMRRLAQYAREQDAISAGSDQRALEQAAIAEISAGEEQRESEDD